MQHAARFYLAIVAATAMAGCAALGASRGVTAPAQEIVWPSSPHEARIRLHRVIISPTLVSRSVLGWVVRQLVGARQDGFIRPVSVATGEGSLVVADAGAQTVWIIPWREAAPAPGRSRRVTTMGDERLTSPVAVAVAPGPRIYVADSFLAKVGVYDPHGRLLSVIADSHLQRPTGLAIDTPRQRLYVADSAAHCVWRFSMDGAMESRLGQRGSAPGEFNFPTHVAVDEDGQVYITDALGYRVQQFDEQGRFAGAFGRHGDSSGDFASPKGLAVDRDRHVYVVDALFDAVQIFDREGRLLLSFGGRGTAPGQCWLPTGLWIERDYIYVADSYNQRLQVFEYLASDVP